MHRRPKVTIDSL